MTRVAAEKFLLWAQAQFDALQERATLLAASGNEGADVARLLRAAALAVSDAMELVSDQQEVKAEEKVGKT